MSRGTRRPQVVAAFFPLLTACEPSLPRVPLYRECALEVRFDPGSLRGETFLELEPPDAPPSRVALRPDPTGTLTAKVSLPPGPVRYRIAVDGQRFTDPENPQTLLDADGVEHSLAEIPDCTLPAWVLSERLDRSGGVRLSLRAFTPTGAGIPAAAPTLTAHLDGRRVEPVATWDDAVTFDFQFPGRTDSKHHFTLEATSADGQAFEPFSAPFWVSAGDSFRWDDAIVYQVVVDRFAAETAFTAAQRAQPLERRIGGNLRGLKRVVESGYFETMGVNVLWLSPLYDNPEDWRVGREGGAAKYVGYHGYWPAADRAVEPAFGTEADVDALVQAAHARGLRVIMDVVLNHVDATHPLARARPDWFRTPACVCGSPACPWSTHIETCWFTEYLPDVDWRVEGALSQRVEAALWWMRRFDLDGLRVDAVPMMPRLVVRRLVAETHRRFEALRERQMLLGETYTGPEGHDLIRWYLGPDGLDSQFDFPLMWALRATLARDDQPLTLLEEVLRNSARAWYGSTAVMAVMVGNHDVPRFVDAVALSATTPTPGDRLTRLKLALGTVYGLPGMPILYYGDEIGVAGAYDPANRAPMRFAADWTPPEAALHDDIARFGRLRACSPALRRGEFSDLTSGPDTLAFWRGRNTARPVLFALNRADEMRTLRLPADDETARLPALISATGAGTVRLDRREVAVVLPAQTAAFFLSPDDPCLDDEAAP